jgi:hypothetical protein
MPVFDFSHRGKDGRSLLDSGPLIKVEVEVPEPLQADLERRGKRVPPKRVGWALIDTGASLSAVHEPVLKDLGISPFDCIKTWSPHGQGRSWVYPAKISFPALGIRDLPMGRVVGSKIEWQASDGNSLIMLLGRDILNGFLFVYNGKQSRITLAY